MAGLEIFADTVLPSDTFVICPSLVLPVVILCASPPKVREVLLAAEELGLMERGEYVFFNVELFAR